MKRLILASSLFFASVAHAVPGTYWNNWYNPGPTSFNNSCKTPYLCELTAPVGIQIRAEDVGKDVIIRAPQAMHCPNITTKDGAPLWSPTGREAMDAFYKDTSTWEPSLSFDVGYWSCEEAQKEGRSRLYWIDTWKKERARVQTLEAQIHALKAKCGRRCR